MIQAFSKYHGLANDFVIIEADHPLDPSLVQKICHRNRGVGADGVLTLAKHPKLAGHMIVQNADGSRPEMCGNGLRCIAFHIVRQHHHSPATVTLSVQTDAGSKDCQVRFDPNSPVATVTIDMGHASSPRLIPFTDGDISCQIHTTSVGNPHAILIDPRLTFQNAAPRIAAHHIFPSGVNVSFVSTRPDSPALDVRVWERGVGPTLACGTAACAVANIAVHQGLARRNQPVEVALPGGTLHITITDDDRAIMSGPAQHVFDGWLAPV